MNNIIRCCTFCIIIAMTTKSFAFGRQIHVFCDIEKCYVVGFSSAEIENTPKWVKTKTNPPVSALLAIKLAEVRKKQLVKDHRGFQWKRVSCDLTPYDERWYWIIRYEAVSSDKTPDYYWPEFGVIVLMDGTVPKHDVQDDILISIDDFKKVKTKKPPKTKFDFKCDGDNGLLSFNFSLSELRKTPKWEKNAQNPPLSARKALQLAEKRKNEFVKDDAQSVWVLDDVQLVPVENNHWYWHIYYRSRVRVGGSGGPFFSFSVVVLMDGTVPKHQKKSITKKAKDNK